MGTGLAAKVLRERGERMSVTAAAALIGVSHNTLKGRAYAVIEVYLGNLAIGAHLVEARMAVPYEP